MKALKLPKNVVQYIHIFVDDLKQKNIKIIFLKSISLLETYIWTPLSIDVSKLRGYNLYHLH